MPVLDLQVEADADDIRHPSNHVMVQSVFAGGNSAGSQDSAARFTGVNIPRNAIVTVGHLIFTPDANSAAGDSVNTNIFAHAADNSPQVANDTDWHNIVDANLTSAFTAYDVIPLWTLDVEEQSPSIVPVIQENVDKGFLQSGILHIFWLDDASTANRFRRAYQHDQNNAKALKIHIEYTVGGLRPSRWRRFLTTRYVPRGF